jgi:SAM-dependent methyltransferase
MRRFLAQLVEEGDLYFTLVVAAVLAIVHYFHLLEGGEQLPAAVLGVLVLVTWNSLRHRRKIEKLDAELGSLQRSQAETARLVAETAEEPGVHWYIRRSDAEPQMYNDMLTRSRLVFIGVSQRSLADYLRHVLTSHPGSTLPWRTIEVYFASPEVGALYEGGDFIGNVRNARQEIASCLTEPTYGPSLPLFEAVQFFQSRRPVEHGGSMFTSVDLRSSLEFEIIYVVHSKFHATELKEGITTRLDATPTNLAGSVTNTHAARIRHYAEVYRNLRDQSRDLGRFHRSIWDISAERWSAFARNCQVLKQSMSHLIAIGDVRPDERALELGARSGEIAEALVGQIERGTVTLLDASPRMTAMARRNFQGNQRVDFALCAVPDFTTDHIDLANRRFSLLVIHQSFQDLAAAFGGDLALFAGWTFDKLLPNGRLTLEAHNSVVETKRPPGYEAWSDKFKELLYSEIRKVPQLRRSLRPRQQQTRYKADQIERAFIEQGFIQLKKGSQIIPISMRESSVVARSSCDGFDIGCGAWRPRANSRGM